MSHQASADVARLDAGERPEAVLADRYQLLRKVGVGGMGTVWLAHDQALDARCAVKVVNAELVANAEVRARFTREAKLSAQLRSPHVVDVFDCGESNGTLYIVMEWLDGESLATRIDRDGKLEPASAYRVVAHVARALTSAHSLGIVHRDLKPDNVFLVPGYDEETAKVLDFGIALDSVYALRDRA
ncbi:MAG TPA: serine/threonine-protein kinase, partial [Polyangiaceae bacterium]|nr:serine/threonine-protein kinase [Polyangiaceae bacterium]